MRPGQLTPNALEAAILNTIARAEAWPLSSIANLHVLSREFTGVGSFTRFTCESGGDKSTCSLRARIVMPGVPNGMGAVLFCKGQLAEVLETFTFGDEHWDGVYEGFELLLSDA